MDTIYFLIFFICLLDLLLYWLTPYKKRIKYKWYKRYLPFSGYYVYIKIKKEE